ncbi:multicomponent Na+:H+ antiporter subunit F [Diaminobutyricimonas aerilata]|uniref:Multicomponent Na+:H+ antiporter subunit F n=1 Tax=Diaminobutyricimonas aerilata TaxID=1162967 RepID=A0A2M9CHE3_9MICO|nr:monovalent cation/H+ antiporter complex subunit F [Diaminobutyricimonas aerilata]PJJ71308.1 multicomponent Na+:H+ antiporter subunit F [Diaminobutyricimonas aerilata]
MSLVYLAVGILLTITAVLAVVRIVRGPSILDRIIASDMLMSTLILVLGTEMVMNGHTRTVPIMLVLAATAVFGSIAVARYVSKQDRTNEGRP